MPNKDVIVIGTSLGGTEALKALVSTLPQGLNASLFVVRHLGASGLGLLPEILKHAGCLPALRAVSEDVTDPEELNRVLRSENEQLKAENKLLKEKVDLLIRRIFGVKSEQLDPAQLELLLSQGTPLGKGVASAEPEATPLLEAVKAAPRKEREKCPHRERWPEDLPVLEEILEPEEVQARPEDFRFIGQEVSETLDYEPARFLCRRLIRRKYDEREEAEEPPVIAPLPESLQQRCLASPRAV